MGNNVYNINKSGRLLSFHEKSQVIVCVREAEVSAIAVINENQEWIILVNIIYTNGLINKRSNVFQNCVDLIYNTEIVLHCSDNGWIK